MKLLLDNNLSHKLCQPLSQQFGEVVHVRNVVGVDADDPTIWDFAVNNGFTILTKDNDFNDWSLLRGCPPKVIHLLCGNQTTLFILQLLLNNIDNIRVFVNSQSENCILKIHL